MIANTKAILGGTDRGGVGERWASSRCSTSPPKGHTPTSSTSRCRLGRGQRGAPMPSEGLGTIEDYCRRSSTLPGECPAPGAVIHFRKQPARPVRARARRPRGARVRREECSMRWCRASAACTRRWPRCCAPPPRAAWPSGKQQHRGPAGARGVAGSRPTASGALVTVPSPAQFGGGSVLAQAGDRYILYAHFETHFVDLSSFPPADRALPGFRRRPRPSRPGEPRC